MSMVGPDKRLNYHRLTPDEVIAALHSHKMGLTNAEARRRAEVQQNTLPAPQAQPPAYRYLMRAQPLTLLTIVAALGLAVSLDDTVLIVALITLLLAHLSLTWLTCDSERAPEPSFARLLPGQTRVVRNGQTEVVATASVVVGDIVQLQAGDIVPADMRLINAQHLATNDAAVMGSDAHVSKFVHALESDTPLPSRNNLAFAGTTVVAGEARGVVIATGEQTELGRIQQLTHAQSPRPTSIAQQLLRQRTAVAMGALATLLFIMFATIQTEPTNAARMFLLALVTFICGTLPFIPKLAGLAAKRRIAREGVNIGSLRDVENLGRADILLCDPTAFGGDASAVVGFAIGRTTYTVNGNGYEPHGQILDRRSKPVTKKALREQSLFFEAATLAHHAAVLAPDAEHSGWHHHGNPTEAALLTAARRAGLHTEQLRDQHESLGFFSHDAHRQLQSAIRTYGKDRVLFVIGSPEALLTRSTKLWDHGHVRPLSASDTAQFATHKTRRAAAGVSCTALAYRILPKNVNVQSLSMERAEQKLTFLGLMDIEQVANGHARALLQAAESGRTRISLLTHNASHYTIDSERLRRMSDERLLERLRKGSATFSQLAAEDKLRLVSVAQQARHTVAMCGTSLSDLPALKLADIAFRSSNTNSSWLEQIATVDVRDITHIAHIATPARAVTERLARTFGVAAISQFAALALSLLSAAVSVFLHTPLGITPLQLLVILVVLQPLAAVFAYTYAADKLTKEIAAIRTMFIFGLFGGCLAFANFLAFFVRNGISPAYLDPTSALSAHATTLCLTSLIVAMWVDALLGLRGRGAHGRPNQNARTPAATASAMGLVILLGIIYWSPLHILLHTQSLDLIDWLYVTLGAALYICLHLFERHTRHHSRRAIVALHKTVYGRSAKSRI